MAAAVLAHGNAGVGTADLYIELGVGNGVADLLVGPARTEHGEGGAEGDETHGGKACTDVHHIALSNAAIKETVGIGGLEILGHGSASQISIQNNDLVIGGTQLYESLAVSFTGCDFFTHGFSPPVPSMLARAARRWAPCHASLPDFP